MVKPADNQQQAEVHLTGGKIALADVTLVADDLVLDVASPVQEQQQYAQAKPGSYTVELFRDEAQVTATELVYGDNRYCLGDIDALQILKLQRRRSVIQKKLSSFLAAFLITAGLVTLVGSSFWFVRLLGLAVTVASIGYVAYFNWWIEQRRRGEFGLLMTTKANTKVVITSHNLKAIQTLYQIMFSRLDRADYANEDLTVNMYTGETIKPSLY